MSNLNKYSSTLKIKHLVLCTILYLSLNIQILVLPLTNLENWASFLTFLSSSFHISNMGKIIVLHKVTVTFK